MVALVTGCAGFIGSFLSEALVSRGYKVIGVDNLFRGKIENLSNLLKNKNFRFENIDLADRRNQPKLKQMLGNVDVVWHLAAINGTQYFYDLPEKVFFDNISITENLISAIDSTDVEYIIYTSSSEVYGEPLEVPTSEDHPILLNIFADRDSYASSKAFGEFILKFFCQKRNISLLVLRLFNVYGERMVSSRYGQVIPEFVRRALYETEFTIIGDGSQTRSFCYIEDAVEIMMSLAEKRVEGILNVGNDEEIRILDLARRIHEIIGRDFKPTFLPPRPYDHKRRRPHLGRLKKILPGLKFTPLDEGLSRVIEYIKNADKS